MQADLQTIKAMKKVAADVASPASIDTVVFTTGIIAPFNYTTTPDGIEIDLAVSYLSRRVILDELVARGLKGRVFIMGFSGEDVSLVPPLNGNPEKYSLMEQHMNTIVANDALVLGYRARSKNVAVYGLNPGMLASDIRSNLYVGFPMKYVGIVLEALLSLTCPSTDDYAEAILPTIAAKELPANVSFFNPHGEAIRTSPFLSDPKNVELIFAETDKLINAL